MRVGIPETGGFFQRTGGEWKEGEELEEREL